MTKRTISASVSTDDLIEGVLSRDRQRLARALTLIESQNPTHRDQADSVLRALLPHTGGSWRIGVTGLPGVGKSTTIESLGIKLIDDGHRVAVLAVDPTSSVSGGSILGDKTRMTELSTHANAYVRPSPTSGALGGVTHATREAILVCEAAGFDIVLVETVGVGQSEITVASMVDFFLVMLLPGAGDELQGLKKGVLEIADMIAINKADGDNAPKAAATAADYRAALNILTPKVPEWSPPVITLSGLTGEGLDTLWEKITEHRNTLEKNDYFKKLRSEQAITWMRDLVQNEINRMLRGDEKIARKISEIEAAVQNENKTPMGAAKEIIQLLNFKSTSGS